MKKLFPIVLILCAIGAWASIITKNINTPKQYEEYLSLANKAYEQEYYYDAALMAGKAIAVEGIENVYEAEVMKRNCYYGLGNWEYYETQCLSMVKKYPEQIENYELVAQYYLDTDDISNLCKVIPGYYEKWKESEVIAQAKEKIDTSYRYIMRGIYDVEYIGLEQIEVQEFEREIINDETVINRKLVDKKGTELFSYGYMKNIPAQDYGSYFVCDQQGNWKRVNSANYLLARNLDVKFEEVGRLSSNNIATVMIDGKYKFMNDQMYVNALTWEKAGTFNEGINAVSNNGRWALVTSATWTDVTEYPYVDVPLNSQNCCAVAGVAVVADEKGYYLVETGEFGVVSEQIYEEIKAFEMEQPTAYREGNKWGFVNTNGEVYIEAMYEDAKPFVNGYAPIKMNGLWGYINGENKIVVEPQFQDAMFVLSSGYAYVKNELGLWDTVIIEKLYYAN